MTNPVTLAVTDHVPITEKARYEALVEELHKMFQTQAGFLSVDIVRHNRTHQVEYTILLRWSNAADVTSWRQDKAIREKLAEIEKITGGPAQMAQSMGLGMWFDHTEGLSSKLPPAWKRIVMSIVAVYPVLMLLTTLSSPFIEGLPQALQVLIIVTVLSTLLTWPIMPWLGRLLRSWLTVKQA